MEYFFEHLFNEFVRPIKNPVLVFSIILFIILIAPLLLKRLNIPSIIGLIISGVLIGPNAFNIIEKNEAVNLFATIGLLYIMFIAGLELDMNDFKKNSNKSLTFGFLTFIIPIIIGYPVCRYLLEYDFNASILTASMFATHTLVAYPIVSKLGIAKNQAVAVSVGGTILTDTAVLLIMAVIISNAEGKLDGIFIFRLGASLVIFGAIMFLIIPPFSRWFFNRLESEHHSHYIFVLSVVFFAAFLSQVAGVEPIIGAFIAGLSLNALIPHTSALMNRIEFIGNALFIPFFLISVGMVVDLKVLTNGYEAWLVAGALTVVALVSKWLAAYFTQKVFHYSADQRQLIFGMSSAHAAATLAIILVGFKAGILDENILNGTIILILVTCIVASFITEKASKSIIAKSANEKDFTEIQYELLSEHILLPLEEDEPIDKVLEFALTIKNKKSVQPISVLSIIDYDDEAEINILKEKRRLKSIISDAAAVETKVNYISSIDHHTGSGIARISREIMANLILMPWPPVQNIVDKFMGEKIEFVVNNTDKTLFICEINEQMIFYKRIVLALPPFAEKENGFKQCVNKIFILAKNLNLKIVLHCNEATFSEIKEVNQYLGYSIHIEYNHFIDWEDFLVLCRDVNEKDLLITITARKGSVSYLSALDSLPAKLEKHFYSNKVLIYPQQFSNSKLYDSYLDMNAEPISKGIKTFNQIKKGIFGQNKKQA